MLLSIHTSNRDNNFTLLRFIASFLVLYTHSFSLKIGVIDVEPMRQTLGMSLGDIAVDIFFITSGFLITSSYINRGNVVAFIWARILRIYPALIVAMTFCVFVIGLWFTNLNMSDYLLHPDTYKYFFKNIMLFFGVEYYLPGVFQDVPYEGAVNGSLWTLPFEVRMYAILAIVLTVVVCLRKKVKFLTFKNVSLFLGIFSILFLILNHYIDILPFESVFVEKFIRLFAMFFVGTMFYIWREYIILSYKWFFILLFILLLSIIYIKAYFLVYTLALPYLILFLSYVPAGTIRKFNHLGDYSYGMYIYAFPIQQSLVALYPNISIMNMVIFSFIFTLVLSILSWHLVEKKFLKLKNNYKFIEDILKKFRVKSKCIDLK